MPAGDQERRLEKKRGSHCRQARELVSTLEDEEEPLKVFEQINVTISLSWEALCMLGALSIIYLFSLQALSSMSVTIL